MTLFDDIPFFLDRTALAEIAAGSISREDLHGQYLNLAKSSDLFNHGYSISHWFNPRTREQVIEYNPRLSDLPRLTATDYETQVLIHRAIGAVVLPPESKTA